MRPHLLLATFLSCLFGTPALAQSGPSTIDLGLTNLSDMALESIDDVNSDGVRDMLVGLPDLDRAEIRSGSNGKLLWFRVGPANSQFGFAVSSASDVDGDGVEDFLVSAPFGGGPGTVGDGVVYHFSGGNAQSTPPNNAANYPFVQVLRPHPLLPATIVNLRFGHSLHRAVDYYGDASDEILIGAPWWTPPAPLLVQAGLVEVRSLGNLLAPNGGAPPIFMTGTATLDLFGTSVSSVTSTATLTFAIAVGAPSDPTIGPGSVSVYAPPVFPASPVLLGTVGGLFLGTGFDVAGMDNVVGAVPQFAVGAPSFGNPLGVVYTLNPTLLPISLLTQGNATIPCQDTGRSVSGVGDYNGNGSEDMLIGAPADLSVCIERGRALILDPLTGDVVAQFTAQNITDTFGWDVTDIATSGSGPRFAVADPKAGKIFIY